MDKGMRETLPSANEELVSCRKGASQRSWSWPQAGTGTPQDREAGKPFKEDTSLLSLKEGVAQREVENRSPGHGKRRSMRTGWRPD